MSDAYLVSKFLYVRMLLLPEEFAEFLLFLDKGQFFPTGRVLEGKETLSYEFLCQEYEEYFASLFGEEQKSLSPKLLTLSEKDLYRQDLAEKKFLLRPCRPLLQMSEHRFVVTSDGRIEPMVYGSKAVRFGWQIAFPTLFMDEGQVASVLADKRYSNGELFRLVQRFVRDKTEPASFALQGKKVITPLRVGKRCVRKNFFDLMREKVEMV